MGYYLNAVGMPDRGKADWLIQWENATELPVAPEWENIPDGSALVVVVENSTFDAAALAFSVRERLEFLAHGDIRAKRFLLMDARRAAQMSGYQWGDQA